MTDEPKGKQRKLYRLVELSEEEVKEMQSSFDAADAPGGPHHDHDHGVHHHHDHGGADGDHDHDDQVITIPPVVIE